MSDAIQAVPIEVLQRVRAEFLEMPGLQLTRAQARRLWALDEPFYDAVAESGTLALSAASSPTSQTRRRGRVLARLARRAGA